MARGKCTVCLHPDRPAIDAEMATQPGVNTAIAERWGLSKDSVRRHRAHLSPAIKAAIARRQSQGARTGVERLEALADEATAVLEQARGKSDGKLQLEAVKRLESIVTTLMKVSGELDDRPQVAVVNVQTSPEWHRIRAALTEALAPYPDAAQAVALHLSGVKELTS